MSTRTWIGYISSALPAIGTSDAVVAGLLFNLHGVSKTAIERRIRALFATREFMLVPQGRACSLHDPASIVATWLLVSAQKQAQFWTNAGDQPFRQTLLRAARFVAVKSPTDPAVGRFQADIAAGRFPDEEVLEGLNESLERVLPQISEALRHRVGKLVRHRIHAAIGGVIEACGPSRCIVVAAVADRTLPLQPDALQMSSLSLNLELLETCVERMVCLLRERPARTTSVELNIAAPDLSANDRWELGATRINERRFFYLRLSQAISAACDYPMRDNTRDNPRAVAMGRDPLLGEESDAVAGFVADAIRESIWDQNDLSIDELGARVQEVFRCAFNPLRWAPVVCPVRELPTIAPWRYPREVVKEGFRAESVGAPVSAAPPLGQVRQWVVQQTNEWLALARILSRGPQGGGLSARAILEGIAQGKPNMGVCTDALEYLLQALAQRPLFGKPPRRYPIPPGSRDRVVQSAFIQILESPARVPVDKDNPWEESLDYLIGELEKAYEELG